MSFFFFNLHLYISPLLSYTFVLSLIFMIPTLPFSSLILYINSLFFMLPALPYVISHVHFFNSYFFPRCHQFSFFILRILFILPQFCSLILSLFFVLIPFPPVSPLLLLVCSLFECIFFNILCFVLFFSSLISILELPLLL